jgi:hypothetical protein
VLESVGTQVGAAEAPVEQAIGRARTLLAAEEAGQVPDVQELSAILEELQSGEAEFHQDLADLHDVAPSRGTGAREAYGELRRNLGMAIVELRVLEDNFMHQLQIVERLQ